MPYTPANPRIPHPILPAAAALLVALAFLTTPLAAAGLAAPPASPPNIILVFMDDMGYADIGPFGGDATLTPNLNQLAKDGRRFTDFYVSQAVCSASRASLMTGCYNVRIGIQGALGPKSRNGINPAETTIAELCRSKGYATACFGKWHLGHLPQFLPLQNGFDRYYGLPYSNDMWPFHPEVLHLPLEERLKTWPHLPLYQNNEVIDPEVTAEEQTLLTKHYTERAVQFIEDSRSKPFFLYLPHSMVHVPLFASKEFQGRTGKGTFADVLAEVDWSIGQLVETTRRLGIEHNTLFIFTSDNGPWLSYGNHAGSAKPLREGKGTMFDGGCRVPCIMKWPAAIPANSVCNQPAMTIDILPTIAELINAPLPQLPIDGLSITALMTEENQTSPHDALYFYWGSDLHAVRSRNWKLHFPHPYRTLNGQPGGTDGIPARYQTASIEEALYDLTTDPGESNNLASQHPEIVTQIKLLANKARTELGDGKQKGSATRP
ncbi:MAG: Arylsulfatase [Planctomycetota bacterium]